MLVIKIELWPGGDGNRARELARTYIVNTGTGTSQRGNYQVAVARKGTKKCPFTGKTQAVRTGEVKDYPRKSYNIWRLVIRSLLSAFPEEGESSDH